MNEDNINASGLAQPTDGNRPRSTNDISRFRQRRGPIWSGHDVALRDDVCVHCVLSQWNDDVILKP